MLKKGIKGLLVQIVAGANIVTAAGMIVTGYSYLVDPAVWSWECVCGLVFPAFLVLNTLFLVIWIFFYPRKMWIPLVTFLLCYFPVRIYMGINIPKSVPDDALKVMTYNVLGFHGLPGMELERDSNAIVEYIISEDCDVVCMQEANESWLSESCLKRLEAKYPHHHSCGKMGNIIAIYSKHKILRQESIDFESMYNLSMAYTLSVDGEEVTVLNNHLETNNLSMDERDDFRDMVKGHVEANDLKAKSRTLKGKLAEGALMRAPQARLVAQYVNYHKGDDIIVMGDFNDSPLSHTRHIIARELTDCFVNSGTGFGWSFCDSGMRVRIDNIMCSEGFTPVRCVVDTRHKYSDHFPMVCWLKKTGAKAE